MSNVNETIVKSTLVELLKDAKVDLSQPKLIKKFMLGLTLKQNIEFFPEVANRLFVEGVYRQSSASNAKGATVGTLEYATAIAAGFGVWQRGYLTIAEETKANRVTTKGATRATLPHTQEAILARMALLAPSGKGERAARVQDVLEKLKHFRLEAFTAYCLQSLNSPESLVAKAIKELGVEQAAKIKAEMEEMLGGVDLI